MCGIVGIFAYGDDAPAIDRSELLRIRDRMTARGPDGCGAWYSADGRVGLGHRRHANVRKASLTPKPTDKIRKYTGLTDEEIGELRKK